MAAYAVDASTAMPYYLILSRGQIWMLTIYGKSALENMPGHLLKRMKEAIEYAEDD